MRILLAQVDPVVGDFAGNHRKLDAAFDTALRVGARVLVGPELAVAGYPPKDLVYRPDFVDAARDVVHALAVRTRGTGLVAVVGAPWRDDGGLRNAALVLAEGRVVAAVAKTLLPFYDVFDEPRWFVPGSGGVCVDVGGLRLGVSICEDLWNDRELAGAPGHPLRPYPVDPFDQLVGAQLVVNLSASPFSMEKAEMRRQLLGRKARTGAATIAWVNQVGANDELVFDGGSLVVGADGGVRAAGASFAVEHLVVDLDAPVRPYVPLDPMEALRRALVLGIREYAARTGQAGALVGLSGGIDSAVVATLAVDALGADAVLGVGLPGPYSSPGSVEDAAALAQALGISFQTLPIDDVYHAALRTLAPVFSGRPFDVAEENLQSRARGTLLMAVSNKLGRMLLSTGNKSELAVGYCTLYGDMDGALAVIGDVYKTDVYRLARHLDTLRPRIPAASHTKPPSAELRPDQTDQDSLPPYETLDGILRGAVELDQGPDALVAAGFDAETVRRVLTLVRRSEFKRWQAPPVLRVSTRAFGSGRRMPLATRWV